MAEPPSLEERAVIYLESTLKDFSTYHNHKEQMAFVATSLYLTVVTALIVQKDVQWMTTLPYYAPGIFIILISLFAIIFVRWQLKNRALANTIIDACNRLRRRWVETYPTADALPASCAKYDVIIMPAFLHDEIRRDSPSKTTVTPTTITISTMIIWGCALLARIYLSAPQKGTMLP